MDYESLLKKALATVPKTTSSSERFEIPKVQGHIEGNKTIINNFLNIAKSFGREVDQLLKYLQRELATPAFIDGQRLILGRNLRKTLFYAVNAGSRIQNSRKKIVFCSCVVLHVELGIQ